MAKLGYMQCHRDNAVLKIGTRKKGDWAVCTFWVDDEMGIGSRLQLDCVADMFHRKYGILGEGELCWTLGLKVKCNFNGHMVTLSQKSYIENLMERFGLQGAQIYTTCPWDDSHQSPVPQDPC